MRTLVLVIEGKNEEHYRYGVTCFEYEEQAKEWCEELNKKQMHKKYWRYAEIIKPDMLYEVNTEKCWDGEIKLYGPDEM
jgi:hypothetical protein